MRLLLLGTALAALVLPPGAPAAVLSAYDSPRYALSVMSDADDAIVVSCAGMEVTVNGLPPLATPIPCGWGVRTLDVVGGPGANRIDLSQAPVTNYGLLKGITARTRVRAGSGDDEVTGPGVGLTTLDGGTGSDRLDGRSVDTYVFGPATAPEIDTIVEAGEARCKPSFAETDVPNRSWWTVPWDALDFRTLPADDPLVVSLAAPGGVLAQHRNRTVLLRSSSAQPFDAVAGGAGPDRISGACMTLGGAGDDVLSGSPTGDLVSGEAGDDIIAGLGGRDTLLGGDGNDRLEGGGDADRLQGGTGDDALDGGAAGDHYVLMQREGRQLDTLHETGVNGIDVLALRFSLPVEVDLGARASARGGDAVLTRVSGRLEGAIGGTGDDVLLGSSGPDHLWGGGGSDLLSGRGGDDVYHIDWAFSLPRGSYESFEDWHGPFDKQTVVGYRYPITQAQSLRLRIVERPGGGRDTIDVNGPGANERAGGPVRVDLSVGSRLVRAGRTTAVAATRSTAANLENVRGTYARDFIVGNGAANVLDGGEGRDDIDGRGGLDTCSSSRSERDRLRTCERVLRVR